MAQQLREATPFGTAPRYLIRDNDRKYGPAFARVAVVSGIRILRMPYRAPRANATCERFLILHEGPLRRALREYCAYFIAARPPQGTGQAIPAGAGPAPTAGPVGPIVSIPVLGSLHHDYHRAA